ARGWRTPGAAAYGDAEPGRGPGRGQVSIDEVFVDVVKCSIEQAPVALGADAGRFGKLQCDRQQTAGVYGQAGRGRRGQALGVDGEQRVPDRGADAADGTDPDRGWHRHLELSGQDVTRQVQRELLEVAVELEVERPAGVDQRDVARVGHCGASVLGC